MIVIVAPMTSITTALRSANHSTARSISHRVPLSSSGARTAYQTPMLAELDREWDRLRRRPRTMLGVRAWFSDDPELSSIITDTADLDGLVDATRGGCSHADALLEILLIRAANDQLAGRIVLQRLLPGLISRARQWRSRPDEIDPTDSVIGAAWIAIRTFDPSRRRRQIAPALVGDATWIAFRREARRMNAKEVPVATNTLASYPAPSAELDPLTALAGTMRAADRAGVPSADLDFIRAIVRAGSPSLAARNFNVTVRTIRNRRDAATSQVARALGADWADWTDPLVAA